MTVRVFPAFLGIVVVLGFAGGAAAQEGSEAAPSPSKEGTGTAAKEGKPSKEGTAQGKASKDSTAKGELDKATFGGGCFWCLEAVFERVKGVKSVVSGYSGGSYRNPSYEMVCTGLTGHAEVVQVQYDPAVVSYDELLNIFWAAHDPTTLNSQGPDEGTQYRSIILYQNETQKQAARKSYERVTAARVFSAPIVTELVPLVKFYPAERYHQDYFRRHTGADYCQTIIAPKLRTLKHKLDSLPPAETPKKAAN